MRRGFSVALAASLAAAPLAAAPLPPPSPAMMALVKAYPAALNSRDIKNYGAIFADNVMITEDGKQVASNKDVWLTEMAKRFANRGFSEAVLDRYIGYDSAVFIERIANFGISDSGIPGDCCAWFRTVKVTLDHTGKIQRLEASGNYNFEVDSKGDIHG